jgi:radical SAM superfamily enzyme YgiQ (UPF0313 family)
MTDALVVTPPTFKLTNLGDVIDIPAIHIVTVLHNNGIKSLLLNANFLGKKTIRKRIMKLDKRLIKLKFIKLNKEVKIHNPKIIILDANRLGYVEPCIKSLEEIKKINSEIKVGVFGYFPTLMPDWFLEKGFDFVLRGDPEFSSLEVCKAILEKKKFFNIKGVCYRNNNKIIDNDVRYEDINSLPIPNKDLVIDVEKYPKYAFSIIRASEGCIYKCSFCIGSNPLYNNLRLRNKDLIIKEILYTMKKYGVRIFYFSSTSFFHNRKWAESICKEIIKRKLKIIWQSYSNVHELADEKLVKLAKESGLFYVSLGLESGSEKILKMMNKPHTNLLMVEKVIKNLKKHNILVGASFIDYPGEDKEDKIKTLEFIRKLKLDNAGIKPYYPMIGTIDYEKYAKNTNFDNITFLFSHVPGIVFEYKLLKSYFHPRLLFYKFVENMRTLF